MGRGQNRYSLGWKSNSLGLEEEFFEVRRVLVGFGLGILWVRRGILWVGRGIIWVGRGIIWVRRGILWVGRGIIWVGRGIL